MRNRPLFQHVSACYTHSSRAGYYGLCRLCAYFCARKLVRARSYGLIVLQVVASSMLQSQQWRWILPSLGPMTLMGFALCAHTFVRINLYVPDHTLLFP